MQRFLDTVLWILAAVTTIYVLDSTSSMTAPIASKFGLGGRPLQSMSPDVYRAFMLVIGVVLPLAIRWLVVGAARRGSRWLNIPNRDYWLAPERRERMVVTLRLWFTLLPILAIAFGLAIHHAVMIANRSDPPRLPETLFWFSFGGFGVLLIAWIAGLYRAMRPSPEGRRPRV